MLKLANVKVGDEVAVARVGSWNVHSEGRYTVVKVDKVKIVLRRAGSDYERAFSVKTGKEKLWAGRQYASTSTFIESASEQTVRDTRLRREQDTRAAFAACESAAQRRDIDALRKAMEKFDELGI